jgi:hypothetical protein
MSTNVIADVAGRFDELMLLIEKMPKGDYIFLGDLVDRGSQSKEVLDWVMKNGKAILGNHEHFMIDAYRKRYYYDPGMWRWNGGGPTIESLTGSPYSKAQEIPEEYIKWVEGLPKYIVVDNVLLTHAPLLPGKTLDEVVDLGLNSGDMKCDESIIWNRADPERHPDYRLQVFGHNSSMQRFVDDKGEFAICLDNSMNKVLTGLHLETMTVYQQKYLTK